MRKQFAVEGAIGLALMGLALWLRAANLDHFVTADEHNWVYRSGLFLHALLQQEWAGTSVWLTPAVTTTWLGSAGLTVHYALRQATIDEPFLTWLVSFSRTRVNMAELLPLRWAMALFTTLMIGLIYGLARKLWARPIAVLGVLFILSGPHLLSLSRIIGHDAPAALLITASLLSFLYARRLLAGQQSGDVWQSLGRYRWFVFSGMMAGLGVLSKAPAMFLIPFAGLIALAGIWQRRASWPSWMRALLVWGGVLWLTFIIVWPAAWVAPLSQTWAVISNAFLYSSGAEDADIQPFYSIPNLGIFYYLINGLFKLSPFVLIGVGLALLGGWRTSQKSPARFLSRLLEAELFWLLLFALLFGCFMTLGVKRSPRYILPAFPALGFVAAWGWLYAARRLSSGPVWQPVLLVVAVAGLNLGLTLTYAPYYFTYYNPLLGGAYTAPTLVRIGWGEGMDQVGRWLDQQVGAPAQAIGARYTVGVHPFFNGSVESPTDPELDYVAFYIKQSQSGYPLPEILDYFEAQGALHRVWLNGIDYAQIYQGPAMRPLEQHKDQAGLPLAYRPHTMYAPLGGSLTVDLLWPAATEQTSAHLLIKSGDGQTIAEAPAPVETIAPAVNVSRHTFDVPASLGRGSYRLVVADRPLAEIKSRLMAVPADFTPLNFVVQYLRLRGYRYELVDQQLVVDLAWQSWPLAITDYTVYVQLLDGQGQRISGVDIAPQPGFTQLDRKEILVARYPLPLPDDLPPGSYKLLIGLYYFAGEQLIDVGSATLPQPINIGRVGE